jgi:beta-barrel assembly-enhancing protease
MKSKLLTLTLILAVAPSTFAQKGKQAEVKIQRTSMSRDQEIQIGKQAAADVERTMEVVKNPEVEAWLNQIGQQLAKTPQANAYPYYFKLVNEESINAFALPGGPMYVHTGLIKAADNESEVAGVLAHEMSHVALRHGAAQMSKQQTWGTVFGVLGAAVGVATSSNGQCGMLCEIGELGAGIAGTSVLMKFSRGYEHDADLNGARMMASAGWDPMGLPTFFEKLQSKSGGANEPKGLQLWLASHPATGSRVQYVSEDIKFYPKKNYAASTGQFARVKQAMASIPPPKPKPAALLQAKQDTVPRTKLPQGFKDYQANGFAIGYPGTWQSGQPQGGGSLYIAPQGGIAQTQNSGVELLVGAMIDYYKPANGSNPVLEGTTNEFVQGLQKGDTSLRSDRPNRVELGGKPALMTKLTTRTSLQREPEQTIYLYTVVRNDLLWYLVLATPPSRQGELEPVFRQIADSVVFPELIQAK